MGLSPKSTKPLSSLLNAIARLPGFEFDDPSDDGIASLDIVAEAMANVEEHWADHVEKLALRTMRLEIAAEIAEADVAFGIEPPEDESTRVDSRRR